MFNSKITRLVIGAVVVVGVIVGLLWYFQQQGFIKIFPTAQDRKIAKILTIDRSKFRAADGLPAAQFEAEIQELYARRDKVLANPSDSVAWFNFGYTKDFLNDHAGAAAAWEESFALQPYNFVTAFNLANTYQYFLKDYPKAETYYLKALGIQPDYTSAYQGLADLYRFNWSEQGAKFEPIMLQAIEKDSANAVAYYVGLVEFFADKNEIAKAKEYLNKLQTIKPVAANQLKNTYPNLQ